VSRRIKNLVFVEGATENLDRTRGATAATAVAATASANVGALDHDTESSRAEKTSDHESGGELATDVRLAADTNTNNNNNNNNADEAVESD
jgi:hypothetical protein